MDPEKVLVVLHRPSSADNIGAAARAMMNFGLSRLVLVAPPSWTGAPRGRGPATAREAVLERARRLARRATPILEAAQVHPDLPSALGDAVWVCGTSSRALEGRPSLGPREMAGEAMRRSVAGTVAIVFGEERRGLSDRELELCQAVCAIPTDPAYDSMNLAQAVAVLCYELGAAGEGKGVGPTPLRQVRGEGLPADEPARHATLEALWSRLGGVLGKVGYLNAQNPEHIMAEWRRLLARAEPSQREVELLVAAIRQVERELRA
jgi:tRNA/rRNA methyltransferase